MVTKLYNFRNPDLGGMGSKIVVGWTLPTNSTRLNGQLAGGALCYHNAPYDCLLLA
ncbi:MAG: hypothetical protein ACOC0N_09580 [Chroococcales cyanobacterium]